MLKFSSQKDAIQRAQRQASKDNTYIWRSLVARIYKELLQDIKRNTKN